MRYSNLHNHSVFSDGVGTLRENVESALLKNMVSLGFSDHSFTACDTSYCMKLEDYGRYCEEVNLLKEEYKDRIPLFLGIECDYYSEIDKSMFDYTIASVHYIIKNGVTYPIDHTPKQQEECMRDAFGGSALDMAKCYFDMITEHAIKLKPTFIGHFDVINKFTLMPEGDDAFRDITIEAMKEIVKVCPYFELNTGGIARGWRKIPYPSPYLLELLPTLGGEILVNSDSHNPDNLDFYFDESIELLKKHGYDHISLLGKDGFYKVKI